MNPIDIILLVFKLAIPGVLAIEKIYGEAKSGTDKKTLAKDSLKATTSIALGALTGDNAQYAQIASEIADDAIDSAVLATKLNGSYQRATARAKVLAAAVTASQAVPAVS